MLGRAGGVCGWKVGEVGVEGGVGVGDNDMINLPVSFFQVTLQGIVQAKHFQATLLELTARKLDVAERW